MARELVLRYAPGPAARLDSIRAFETLRRFTIPLNGVEAERLLADPRVAYAAEDPVPSIDQMPTSSWAVDRLDQRTLPLDGRFEPVGSGRGVRIYIFDTGVRATHQEYAARVRPGLDGFSGAAASGSDCHGHGTFVASNAAGGTFGVARDAEAEIVDVRVLPCSGGGVSAIPAGADWVIRQKQAEPSVPMVVNMSLGGRASLAIDDAVRQLTDAGVTVVVAAGNASADACGVSPARRPGRSGGGGTALAFAGGPSFSQRAAHAAIPRFRTADPQRLAPPGAGDPQPARAHPGDRRLRVRDQPRAGAEGAAGDGGDPAPRPARPRRPLSRPGRGRGHARDAGGGHRPPPASSRPPRPTVGPGGGAAPRRAHRRPAAPARAS